MLRVLQAGDFLPDFELRGTRGRLHVSGLAGAPWILVAFRDANAHAHLKESLRPLLENSQAGVPVVSAIYLPRCADEEPDTDFYTFWNESVRDFLLGDDVAPHEFSCLVIDRSLKIQRRIDDLGELTSTEARDRALKVASCPDGAALIPVLHVPNALSPQFCAGLIDYFENSCEQAQANTGQSSSQVDLEHRRALIVRADRDMAMKIDRQLMFSLMPAVERVFDVRPSHRIAYKINCYDAAQSGFLGEHRENNHYTQLFERFNLVVLLNEGWDGDGIRFPEFSNNSFRLATGDAVVFPVSLLHRAGPITTGKRFSLVSGLYGRDSAQLRRATMTNPGALRGINNDRFPDELLAAYDEFAPAPRFSPQFDELDTFAAVAAIRRSANPRPDSAR